MLRDLGSANGTFVNGKRVLGQQRLQSGDVITIGGVTLRIEQLDAAAKPKPASPSAPRKEADTAELVAIPVGEEDLEIDDEEFEIEIEDEPDHIDLIPLEDEPVPAKPAKDSKKVPSTPSPAPKQESKSPSPAGTTKVGETSSTPRPTAEEEDAVAQFLMDLKLDEDD
jgi:pSer/pThr/pTyr-binding forkhead associated (FHA) protein